MLYPYELLGRSWAAKKTTGVKLITENEELFHEDMSTGLQISIVHATELWMRTNSISPVDNQWLLT